MTHVKNARQLLTVAQGFEPHAEDAMLLLADALAHAVQAAGISVEDAVSRLRDSAETLTAAVDQSRHRPFCQTCGCYDGRHHACAEEGTA